MKNKTSYNYVRKLLWIIGVLTIALLVTLLHDIHTYNRYRSLNSSNLQLTDNYVKMRYELDEVKFELTSTKSQLSDANASLSIYKEAEDSDRVSLTLSDWHTLAKLIAIEAGYGTEGEPYRGQVLVARVMLNRLTYSNNIGHASTIKGIINAPGQFPESVKSMILDESKPPRIENYYAIADAILNTYELPPYVDTWNNSEFDNYSVYTTTYDEGGNPEYFMYNSTNY